MSAQFDGGPGPLALVSQDEAPQKQKLNIFEQKDTAAIKTEQFAKLGYLPEKSALAPVTSNLATFQRLVDFEGTRPIMGCRLPSDVWLKAPVQEEFRNGLATQSTNKFSPNIWRCGRREG